MTSDTVETTVDDAAPRHGAFMRAAMLGAAIIPIVVSIVRGILNDWFPIGDSAQIYIRVADVATRHHPLLAQWTSASQSVGENMNNPGPIYYDLAAPFAKLFDPAPGGALAVGTINILCVVAISVCARRIGGWAVERWALLAAVLLVWTMGSEILLDLFQAHALMLPFLLFLVLAVGLADGQTWALGWSLAVASVIVQTHISYAYILAVLWPAATISYFIVRRGRPHLPLGAALRSRRAAWIAGGMLLLWSQSLIEQFFGPGKGNLSRLVSNAGGGDLQVGGADAVAIAARVYTLPPWWLRSGFSSSVPNTPLSGTPDAPRLDIAGLPGLGLAAASLAVLVALLGLGIARHRRGELHVLGAASLVATVGVVGSVLAVANLTVGPVGLAAHHVRLLWPLAVFVHTVALALVVAWARTRTQVRLPWALPVLAVAVGVAALPYHEHPQGSLAFSSTMTAMRRIFPHLDQVADLDPVLYDMRGVRPFEPFSSTMMMELQARGIEFRTDDEVMVRHLGEARRADGTEAARLFQLQGAPAVLYDGDACLIAMASELPADVEQQAAQWAEALSFALTDGSVTIAPQAADGTPEGIPDVIANAAAGDLPSARILVYEGYLSGWYSRGLVTIDDDLAVTIPVVDQYMNTVYALYSDQSAPCPG